MSIDLFGSYTMSTEYPEPTTPYLTDEQLDRARIDRPPVASADAGPSIPLDLEPLPDAPPHPDHAGNLRVTTAAVAVSFTWMGVRKTLSSDQRHQIADGFDADKSHISAGKKLINTGHPKFKALTALRTRIIEHWKDNTLPFPEPGTRLIRRDRIEDFTAQMDAFRADLDQLVDELEDSYPAIREEARDRLGALYNPADYPATLRGPFSVACTFPNVEPPSYLMQLHPAVYDAERARVAQQFEESVRLAEASFIEQFEHLITHLCERLERGEDGRPKTFQASTIDNLTDFFERFKSLNIGSNDRLDALVEHAKQTVRGATPRGLRTNAALRDNIRRSLNDVAQDLGEMMVAKPLRRIIRPTPAPAQDPTPTRTTDEGADA